VVLVRTGVSEKHIAPVIRATRIGELATEQEPHGVTSQKTAFLKVTAVKPSNLTNYVTF
jgi:hypothetical protein